MAGSGGRRGGGGRGGSAVAPERQWFRVKGMEDSPGVRLRVMTLNVLADYLAHQHQEELYRDIPNWVLDWRRRLQLLVAEVLSHHPDVLCLQEVDHFNDIRAALEPHGYGAHFVQRTNQRADGCAMLWNKAVLQVVQVEQVRMQDLNLRDNVTQLLLFQVHGAAACHCPQVLVANTHLLFNPKRGDIKMAQIRVITRKLSEMAAAAEQPVASVLAGDLNLTPGSPLYWFLEHGRLDCLTADRRNLSGQIEHLGQGPAWHNGHSGRRGGGGRHHPYHQHHHGGRGQNAHDHHSGRWSQSATMGNGSTGHHQRGGNPEGLFRGRPVSAAQVARSNGWEAEHLAIAAGPIAGWEQQDGGAASAAGGEGAWTAVQQGSGGPTAELGLRVVSSHAAACGREPGFTTAHDKSVSTVDYIWFTPKGLPVGGRRSRAAVAAVLLPPPRNILRRGLPSSSTGSDHICQVSDLQLSVGSA